MVYQTHRIEWQGIEIEARYNPGHHGGVIAHLEIKTFNPPKARLPITETGYLSHFHAAGMIERDFDGNVIAAVTAWLDEESKSKLWQNYVESMQQLELF